MVKIGNREFGIGILALIIIFSFILFGFIGVKVVLGAVVVFFLPFYLILDNFDIEFGEKIVFSFFMGIGVFSIFVYYLGFVVNSIRVAIAVTFLLLVGVGIGLKKFRKK